MMNNYKLPISKINQLFKNKELKPVTRITVKDRKEVAHGAYFT